MARLGPFEHAPRLAAAVSGGADSLALALLADSWARAQSGSLLCLIVDHGLRDGSAAEARLAAERLTARCISARILTLHGLAHGSALAERARQARYAVLAEACRQAGIAALLLGHHAVDQAETVLMRLLSGSGPDGLAGMAARSDRLGLRLLRPLLDVPPVALRHFLSAQEMGWSEDPSNANPAALRARLRADRRDPDGTGPATWALTQGAALFGAARAKREAADAALLARRVRFHPEGFAVLAPGALPSSALSALLRAVAGTPFPPPPAAVAALAASPRPATLGGVRLLPAGRLGPGLLVVREPAAMAPALAAQPGTTWDGRFRLRPDAKIPTGPELTLGPLGAADGARLRRHRRRPYAPPLPALVAATLPAVRHADVLVAVPHLCYPDPCAGMRWPMEFVVGNPVDAAPFVPAQGLLRRIGTDPD
jgi:tRNA(Ile)-lysidine synthase